MTPLLPTIPFTRRRILRAVGVIVAWPLLALAETKPDYIPQPGQFPPSDSGYYIAGELVMIDPVNRRG